MQTVLGLYANGTTSTLVAANLCIVATVQPQRLKPVVGHACFCYFRPILRQGIWRIFLRRSCMRHCGEKVAIRKRNIQGYTMVFRRFYSLVGILSVLVLATATNTALADEDTKVRGWN